MSFDFFTLVYFWLESVIPNNIIIMYFAGFKPKFENVHLYWHEKMLFSQYEYIETSPKKSYLIAWRVSYNTKWKVFVFEQFVLPR